MTNRRINQHVIQTTGWVPLLVGDRWIANMQDLIVIQIILAFLLDTQTILLSGTQTKNKPTTNTRVHSVENGLWEITN